MLLLESGADPEAEDFWSRFVFSHYMHPVRITQHRHQIFEKGEKQLSCRFWA